MTINARVRADSIAREFAAAAAQWPTPVRAALDGYNRAASFRLPKAPQPTARVNQAVAAASLALAQTAQGRDIGPDDIDTSGIVAARVAEAADRDRSAVARQLAAMAAARLCEIVDEHAAATITAIKAAHREAVGEMMACARELDPAMTDDRALQVGGAVRAAWLALRDVIPRLLATHASIAAVEQRPVPASSRTGQAAHIRSRLLAEHWSPTEQHSHFGPPSQPRYWIELSRRVDAGVFWCPTPSELIAFAQQWEADDERAANVAALRAR